MARPVNRVVPFVLALLVLSGCKKPEDDLGLNLLPGDPLGVTVDTTSLHAFTYQDTVIRTSGLTRNLLGSYLDPQFGLLRAGIVAQLRLSSNNVGAGQDVSGLVPDSLVLALAFDGINYAYGNLHAQVFQVHELATSLSLDSVYHTDDIPDVVAVDLAAIRGGRITPEPLRKPVVGGDSLQPQLRIRLNNALAERFMLAFGTPDLLDNTAFLDFFKGLYITVDNGTQLPFQQGLLYFNLLNSASNVTLYYRDLNNDPDQARTFIFPINQSSVRYTTVEHQYELALDPRLAMAFTDTVSPAAVTFVRSLGGARTAVRFPALMDYAATGLALAKAVLVVPLDGSYNPFLPPPSQMFIFRKDNAGRDVFLPDQSGGVGTIDGNFRADQREYRFNITRYVQAVLAGTIPNNGVVLVPGSNGITANRAVLAGPANALNPMRMELTFTTY